MKTHEAARALTAGQRLAIQDLGEVSKGGLPHSSGTIKASEYLDAARFEVERKTIFRHEPMLVAASAQIPKSRMVYTLRILGTPVLLTRAKDGVVRAFINVCKHRGTILCPREGAQELSRLSCPYHAWTYGLDGALVGIPREEIFDGIEKGDFRLTELQCAEAGGLIWVGLDPSVAVSMDDVTGEIADDLSAIGLQDMYLYKQKTYEVSANWKLVMDTMLDSYHVIRLHKDTLAPFFVDAPMVLQTIGPHLRSTSIRGNFEAAEAIKDFASFRKMGVFSYALFPTGIVVVSPHYVSVSAIRPTSVDTCEVDYLMLIGSEPEDERSKKRFNESFELMDRAFGKEDYWAAELGQQGLASGAISDLTLGGMEEQMMQFHVIVDQRIKKAIDATQQARPDAG